MNYREQVQRVLSIHHARIELGLSRSREQEGFVRLVGNVLKRNKITFKTHLNTDFEVVFTLSAKDAGLLKHLFLPRSFDLVADGAGVLVLSHHGQPHIQVTFEFKGDKP